jgi:hypothetical protein
MSECWSVPLAICKKKKSKENGAIWFAKEFEMIYTFTFTFDAEVHFINYIYFWVTNFYLSHFLLTYLYFYSK